MLKEDHMKPEHYNLLIGECGHLGYKKEGISVV
jgi:hypothetical protein